ncbi:YjiH family protein [Pontibacillus yanchengensis]|uniref:Membrane protein n=1 Tax=Pontibacillus yanchengensis Y32 TaxID=1385514 RepID=A0A0A2TCZ2_9BACI|nr:YjiH family protein [Pontibacillus yanchengensis]KGP71951.1 membrane protein [Pontibacillus yanchengensis Y32]
MNEETVAHQSTQKKSVLESGHLKFLIPSLIGILLFLVPIPFQGKITIGVGILAESVQGLLSAQLPAIMTTLILVSSILAFVQVTMKPAWMNKPILQQLFSISPLWTSLRLLGALLAILTLFQLGPEWIWSEASGGTVLYSLIPVLTTWFLFAALLMPFLMEFGLMEFVGTMLRKIMRPLFTLPGRSSIDATASWMGAGPVGVLITTQQYEQGYYDKREASVIASNFSINSIAFSLVVISFIGLEHLFVPFYFSITVAVIVAAIIMPRIPPLSLKKKTYHEPVGKQISEDVPEGKSITKWGTELAVSKANSVSSLGYVFKKGFTNVLDIWFGLLPIVMALGTVALILAEFTPIFTWLSAPIVPVLQWMNIPEASAAAPAMIVGFADMFLPAVIGKNIESELTRFIIAGVSITQLIYMSEIGVLLLKSKIPIKFWELAVIFIQRTIITLPIITLMAHWLL